MSKFIQAFVKIVILLCLAMGAALIITSREERATAKKKMQLEHNNPKALMLKKFLLGFKKPERVEVFNYTKKYEKDVNDILNMQLATDPNSDFYIGIQFFTDETDAEAPLVAQIRFFNIKSDNLLKEHVLNLE